MAKKNINDAKFDLDEPDIKNLRLELSPEIAKMLKALSKTYNKTQIRIIEQLIRQAYNQLLP